MLFARQKPLPEIPRRNPKEIERAARGATHIVLIFASFCRICKNLQKLAQKNVSRKTKEMILQKNSKIHCFFEQSGTFKNQFIKLGFMAYDYDIQNEYAQTDYCIDLFAEIEKGFNGEKSIFDTISKNDLIFAFFPCIYFSCYSQMAMYFSYTNYQKLSVMQKSKKILQRSANREKFFALAVKMFAVALDRGLRLIMENPWSEQTFLRGNFVVPPSYIDMDRSKRGDHFKKPTAYWFLNCEPCKNYTLTPCKDIKRIADCKGGGRREYAAKSGVKYHLFTLTILFATRYWDAAIRMKNN